MGNVRYRNREAPIVFPESLKDLNAVCVGYELEDVKTAPQALTERTMTGFMRNEPSAPAVR